MPMRFNHVYVRNLSFLLFALSVVPAFSFQDVKQRPNVVLNG
jgi:hypothetical protein